MNTPALREEIASFFDGFAKAFISFSGARIATVILPIAAGSYDGGGERADAVLSAPRACPRHGVSLVN